MSVEAWLGPRGALSRCLPGYEARAPQLEMARAVERALADDATLLVEAGTGTGKTLAYLLPAITSGRKVVVSTGTKTLQDQIMQQDLALLQRVLGEPVSAVAMKGLGNYLCLRRYDELIGSAKAISGAAARQLPVLQAWLQTTQTGERSELAALGEGAALWHEVQSGSDTRIGSKCGHHDECFVTHMRRAAEDAQLLVVNHHLFFADLALRDKHGGGVIPPYEAAVFDEAHMLEDVATEFFGVSLSTTKLEVLGRDSLRALSARALREPAERLVSTLLLASAAFFQALPLPKAGERGRVPLPPSQFAARLQDPMFALDNALDALFGFCKRHAEQSEAIAQLARRVDQSRAELATIAQGGERGQVTWTLARGRSVSVGASPIEVSGILRESLFQRGGAVVLTSATLSAAGSFDYVKARLGVEGAFGAVREALLPSPFDYEKNAALYLPQGLGDPREPGFMENAAREILALVALTGGGAFVLCTSLRAMHELAARCAPELRQVVLVQGEAPSAALLDRFRQDGNAVLFATASFWQGVDVPGDALRLVVLDKLPFDVPTDPLVAARCDKLKERGIEPFMSLLVPSAALTLKQGFGRLIRTRRDRGVVALLDERVSTKGYGKVFLRSLPPARTCRGFDEVRRFWTEHAAAQQARPAP